MTTEHVIEAGLTGDILIAQAAGWRMEFWKRDDTLHSNAYWFYAPDGSKAELVYASTEDEAWRYAADDGSVPRPTTDLNAAAALPIEDGMGIELRIFEKRAYARLPVFTSSQLSIEATQWTIADTPALAVCRAWWAWHEAQKESE